MKKIKEENYFVCIASVCETKDMLGNSMCEFCYKYINCDCCGKRNTIFCGNCTVNLIRGNENERKEKTVN